MKKDESNHSSYLLVCGLGSKIKQLRQLGLKTPSKDDSIFKEFQSELVSRIGSALPETEVIVIDEDELADSILAKTIEKRTIYRNATFISTCKEILASTRGHVIEINRMVNLEGEIIGIGPRPGYPPLEEQVWQIDHNPKETPIILIEDGSFSGGTICHILKQLQVRGLSVSAIVTGFLFPQAIKKIKQIFKGELIPVENNTKLIDWMPDYDFIPFAPNCGRVLGIQMGESVLPFYSHEGASFSIPYILPFGKPTEWASIPKEAANSFSLFCAQAALGLFSHLNDLNKKHLMIGDVFGSSTHSRVTIPINVGQKSFPGLSTSITSFLSDVCHELI